MEDQKIVINNTIKIYAFKDISAFIFHEAKKQYNLNAQIVYVKNADEAHNSLINSSADIVFMSYDDTLSMSLKQNYSQILAVMPVHYGILDLCGQINLQMSKNKVGIDTQSGYARALQYYLQQQYRNSYNQIIFQRVGATNIRYDKLTNGIIDATLLNPPFSYKQTQPVIAKVFDIIGPYQGVVANVNQKWLNQPSNRKRLNEFTDTFSKTIKFIVENSDVIIKDLQQFYSLSSQTAKDIYNRLLAEDGLNNSLNFDNRALTGTEKLFTWSTNIEVPSNRTWVLNRQ